jgi:hypothetical protein
VEVVECELTSPRRLVIIDVEKGELFISDRNNMVLQARCETIVSVYVNYKEMEHKDILIHAKPITDNISCGNVLNQVINQQLLVKNQNIRQFMRIGNTKFE